MTYNFQQITNTNANYTYIVPNQNASSVSTATTIPKYNQNATDNVQLISYKQQKSTKGTFFEKHWGKILTVTGIAIGTILTRGKLWGKIVSKNGNALENAAQKGESLISSSKGTEKAATINTDQTIKKLGNGRIEVNRTNKSGNNDVIELPEYMYHITSSNNINSILQSGKLNKSLNEQLTGVFLLDSQNFLNHYQKVDIGNGNTLDLTTSLFRQATKNRPKNATLASQKVNIIKIPTEELIKNGKLRVRCQEDFFKTQTQLLHLQTKSAKKINVRAMGDKANRDILKQNLLNNGMNEADADKLLKEIEEKLHQGYTITNASKNQFEKSNAIEYIYNQDIELSKIKGIKYNEINLNDIVKVSQNKEIIDASKLSTVFN